jgi:peptidoglycan/xylan/chitin deacetylase (PgdA/CDA1 family)
MSLDFELAWGTRDLTTSERYRENILGSRTAVPLLLDAFTSYGIHGTWAIVGFVFFRTRADLLENVPQVLPAYAREALSPYADLAHIGQSEEVDPIHYGASLVERIRSTPNQEIATHTFSHYYCLEEGQTVEAFRQDLAAAFRAAQAAGVELRSIVLPRNQIDKPRLDVCRDFGIRAYRGAQDAWMNAPLRRTDERKPWRRALRLADTYVPLSGPGCYAAEAVLTESPANVRASRYLRPFSRTLRSFEGMRLRRILGSLDHAAREGLVYHLWWHPEDFGVHQDENLAFLGRILDHFATLRRKCGMRSLTMLELAESVSPPGQPQGAD